MRKPTLSFLSLVLMSAILARGADTPAERADSPAEKADAPAEKAAKLKPQDLPDVHLPKPKTGDVMRLWLDKAPRATGDKDADVPTITAFVPGPDKANGCAVVICPGGGYSGLMMSSEGADVAKWFTDHGLTCFVLKYRISPYGQPVPMLDAQRAIRLVRYNAKPWGLDWKRIGIMGFSAGGHVASTAATHYDAYIPGTTDPVNTQSCRPDFQVLIYPVISMRDKITHVGSRHVLIGDKPPQKLINLYSNESQVTDDTPPAFIVAAKPDSVVPVKNSQLYAAALKSHRVPHEYLEFPTGEHGFGLAQNDPQNKVWPDKCMAFLDQQKLLKPAAAKPTTAPALAPVLAPAKAPALR